MVRFFTIGHSTRSTEEFIGLLTGAGVTRVVDVRRFPHSRRHPRFDGEALAASLASHRIAYWHEPDLGGRRGASEAPESTNRFWQNRSFRHYADYAMSEAFQRALRALLDAGRNDTCSIMCAEAVWWRCHRRIISDYLLHHGAEVFHILGDGQPAPARMTPAATPDGHGALVYPDSP